MKLIDIEQENYNKIVDLENLFSVYLNKKDDYFFNLNETIYVNIDKRNLKTFVVDHALDWPVISYRLLKTTRLAWLLMKLNDVKQCDIFKKILPGTIVYYPDETIVSKIAETIYNKNIR